MIARVDGQVVLVSGAIPGERVSARIDRVGKGVAYAQAMAVEEPSADRREAFSDPRCGGCSYSHIAYPRQLEIKAQVITDAFVRIGRLTLPNDLRVAASQEEGYRMRARFHLHDGRPGFSGKALTTCAMRGSAARCFHRPSRLSRRSRSAFGRAASAR